MKFFMNTGSLFKTIRRTTGLTQEQFAKKYAIDITHLRNIERGAAFPSIRLIMELEQMCDITVHFSVECDYKVLPRAKRRRNKMDPSEIKVFNPEDFLD